MPPDNITMQQKRVTFLLKTLTDYTLSVKIPAYRDTLNKRRSSGENIAQYENQLEELKRLLEEQADSVYDLSLTDLHKAEAQLKEALRHTGYLKGKADFLDNLDVQLNMPVITTAAEKTLSYDLESNIERAVGYSHVDKAILAELGNPAVLLAGAAVIALLTVWGGGIAEAVLLALTAAGIKSNLDGILAGIQSLIKFFRICAKAKTEEELKEAGSCFSDAAAKLSINGIFLVLACGGMKAKAETNGFEFLKPQFTREFNKNKIGAGQRVYESSLAPRNVQREARQILTDAGYKNEKVLTDEDTINQLNTLRKTYSDDELIELIKVKRAQGTGLKKILENLNEQSFQIPKCTEEDLYLYLKSKSVKMAEEYRQSGLWPEKEQMPRETDFLTKSGKINWDKYAPEGGYVLDENGIAIKSTYTPQKGEILDRYGPSNGRYTSPVIDGKPYSYGQRSLPFVKDKTMYHQYEVIGDFNNIEMYIENCPNTNLKAIIKAFIAEHDIQYTDLTVKRGYINGGFNSTGGGLQYELPLSVEWLEKLGLLKKIK